MTVENRFEPGDHAKARQRAVLLAELRQGPVTTIQAREALGIMSPAARVLELRRSGLDILTVRARIVDSAGALHAMARYVLRDGGAA
ncbi:helix-turn-helix domain-containing protein [Zoogloea sp.]|uniref:helix-turn-helix domain-containing protein n=1 Tax=Zoogloea sp. TaxID=49181 RepID=UPI0035B28900